MFGRGIAAVGVVLAFVAIWVRAVSIPEPTKYWDDGTFGGLLLILAILAALALIGAYSTGRREYDLALGGIGGVAFGMYLFFPAVLAFDQWEFVDTGGWLGLCSGLTFIGAAIAAGAWPDAAARPAALGTLVALAGLGLVAAGIWPDFQSGASYWSIPGLGHSFGILLIILVVLGALSLAAAQASAAGLDSALLVAAVTLGATIAIPVGNAFNHFGRLEAGAWLAAAGGVMLMAGVLAMRRAVAADVTAPVTTPPAA